jgi:ferredoxin-type protein NapF
MPTTRRGLFGLGRPSPTAAVTITDGCLARLFVHCQSCGDACPEQAIGFRPRLGGPPLPTISAERCTGCGECIAACPADAIVRTAEAPRG